LDHPPRSASCSEQRLGCGCGASGASITRRWLALSLSSGGGRTLPATNYGLVFAAPVAAAKEQPSSTQAGPAIISASSRFRSMSATKTYCRARCPEPKALEIVSYDRSSVTIRGACNLKRVPSFSQDTSLGHRVTVGWQSAEQHYRISVIGRELQRPDNKSETWRSRREPAHVAST
jgi:hypothetical protein